MENSKAVFVGDIVEDNGKTVKENNLEKKHSIPLGSLVEITYEDSHEEENMYGTRAFVVQHSRDCDGTPLYSLSLKKTAGVEFEQVKADIESGKLSADDRAVAQARYWLLSGAIINGYDEDNLKLIK